MVPFHPRDLVELLSAVDIGLWHVEVGAEHVWWCPRTCAIHEVPPGSRPTLEAAIGFYAPRSRPIIEAAVQRGIDSGETWDVELEIVTAANRLRWVRARGRVVRNEEALQLLGTIEDITEKRQRAAEHDRFAMIIQQMTNAAIITDASGLTTWVNPAFERLTGFTLSEMIGRPPGVMLQGSDTDSATISAMRKAVQSGQGFHVEILNYRRDGRPYWIDIEATPIREPDGTLRGFVAIEADIDARRSAELAAKAEAQRRAAAEVLLRDVINALPNAVFAFDPSERLILSNAACDALFPRLSGLLHPGAKLADIVREAAGRGQFDAASGLDEMGHAAWIARHLGAIRNPGPSREMHLPDGRWVQLRESHSASGNLVCVRTDITRLKAMEEQARRRSEEDPLTGTASRAALLERLRRLATGLRSTDTPEGCLILFDIDHFKAINDGLGHQAGDEVLKTVADRVLRVIRQGDTLARLGGDEFALLLPGLIDPVAIERLLARLCADLAEPIPAEGRLVKGSFSFGVAILPNDALDAEDLFRCADSALYHSKRQGRGRWSFFDRALANELSRRAWIAARMPAAIAEERIGVFLQPKHRLLDGGHAGFEALARWTENDEPIPPATFVSVAEDNGLGVALGTRVLDAALRATRDLIDSGLEPGRIAVNVTTQQLLVPDAADIILNHLKVRKVEAQRLEIEVTETVLLDRSVERIAEVLAKLRHAGVTVALDDFGTGYASLAHLTRFPVSCIKIDRRFVAALGHGGADALIAQTVIGLARGLGVETVAEGVEEEPQRLMLRELGCDIIQGYLIAKPLSPDAARDFLQRKYRATAPRPEARPQLAAPSMR